MKARKYNSTNQNTVSTLKIGAFLCWKNSISCGKIISVTPPINLSKIFIAILLTLVLRTSQIPAMCKKIQSSQFLRWGAEGDKWEHRKSLLSKQLNLSSDRLPTSLLFLSDTLSTHAYISSMILTCIGIAALRVAYHANRLHYHWWHLSKIVLYLASISSCCDRWWGNWASEWLKLYTVSLHSIFIWNIERLAFCWKSTFKKRGEHQLLGLM